MDSEVTAKRSAALDGNINLDRLNQSFCDLISAIEQVYKSSGELGIKLTLLIDDEDGNDFITKYHEDNSNSADSDTTNSVL